MKKRKCAIILSRNFLYKWEKKCIEYLLLLQDIELSKIYMIKFDQNKKRERRKNNNFYTIFKKYFEFYTDLYEKLEIPLFLKDQICIIESISDLVNSIMNNQMLFILKLGIVEIPSEILDLPQYGVWAFFYCNSLKYPNNMLSFWEFVFSDPITVVSLKKLTKIPNLTILLNQIKLKTNFTSFYKNCTQILFESAKLPYQICLKIKNNDLFFNNRINCQKIMPTPNKNHYYLENPKNGVFLRFILTNIYYKIKFYINRRIFYDYWSIGIMDSPIQAFVENLFHQTIHWIKNPDNYILADPFGIKIENREIVVVESLNPSSYLGHLSKFDIFRQSAEIKTSEIEKIKIINHNSNNSIFHYSYPYIFQHEHMIYCIPETSQQNKIILYQFEDDFNKLNKKKVLIENFSSVDPTIFKYQNRWWLFCCLKEKGSPPTKLFIFYSNDLFGQWIPHKQNPVKIDIQTSRSAGKPFFYRNQLIRPSQDCSKSYGYRIILNQIIELNPFVFREKIFKIINPEQISSKIDGIHTLSYFNEITLIDAKIRRKKKKYWKNFTELKKGMLFTRIIRFIKKIMKFHGNFSPSSSTLI
ncbi:glucosamine inositolphosphorylceramide transferase family protein [Candidatus Harpocratesius sp.]